MEESDDECIDFPETPDAPAIYEGGGDVLADGSTSDLIGDSFPINLKERDVVDTVKDETNRKVFIAEMQSYDVYLHNMHKLFPKITTVRSAVTLVAACLTIHKHRRSVLEKVSGFVEQDNEPVYDVMGNIVQKRR